MRGVVWLTGRVVSPFGDPPGEVPLPGQTLAQHRVESMEAAGCGDVGEQASGTTLEGGQTLIVADDVLIGRKLLRRFVSASRAGAASQTQLCVRPGALLLEAGRIHMDPAGVEAVPFDVYWVREGSGIQTGTVPNADAVILEPEEQVMDIPVPAHWFGKETMYVPMSGEPIMWVRHWVDILAANRVVGAEAELRRPRWRLILRVLWAALRSLWT